MSANNYSLTRCIQNLCTDNLFTTYTLSILGKLDCTKPAYGSYGSGSGASHHRELDSTDTVERSLGALFTIWMLTHFTQSVEENHFYVVGHLPVVYIYTVFFR